MVGHREFLPYTVTLHLHLVKYDSRSLNAFGEIFNANNLCKSPSCQKVPKAFSRSRNAATAHRPRLIDVVTSVFSFKRGSIVEHFGVNPHWVEGKTLFS